MFRNNVALGSENLVGGKTKKTLLGRLPPAYHQVLDKNSVLKQAKIAGSKVSLIFKQVDGAFFPYIIDCTHGLCPTLMLLWEDNVLPSVLIHQEVSRFILNGANLMWPGVLNKEEVAATLQENEWVAVKVAFNPKVCAVGKYHFNETFTDVCVEVLHYFGDGISRLSNITPENFTSKQVFSIPRLIEEAKSEAIPAEVEEEEEEKAEDKEEKAEENEAEEEQESGETEEEVKVLDDELVMKILLTALAVGVPDSALPIEPRDILQLMHACKRNIPFDIKHTQFRKIGALLQHAHKQGILRYVVPSRMNNKQVVSINRTHEVFHHFTPIVQRPVIRKAEAESGIYPLVSYQSVLIPSAALFLFLRQHFRMDKPSYTQSQVSGLMGEYCSKKHLDAENKAFQRIDYTLAQLLDVPEGECHKAQVKSLFLGLFQPGYLRQTSDSCTLEHGSLPTIRLIEEISKWQRFKTVVLGLELFEIDLETLADEFQKAFGTSSKPKFIEKIRQSAVVVQGKQAAKISKFLSKKYKVPSRQITIKS